MRTKQYYWGTTRTLEQMKVLVRQHLNLSAIEEGIGHDGHNMMSDQQMRVGFRKN